MNGWPTSSWSWSKDCICCKNLLCETVLLPGNFQTRRVLTVHTELPPGVHIHWGTCSDGHQASLLTQGGVCTLCCLGPVWEAVDLVTTMWCWFQYFFYSHTKSMMLNMPHKNQYNLPGCYNNSRLRQWLVFSVGWFLYYGPHVAFILEKHVIRRWTGALIWQWLWSGHYRMRLSPRLLSSFPALVTRGKVCFATRWTRIIWWLGLLRHLQQWRHWAEWIYPPAAPASKIFSYLNLSWNWLPQGKLQGSVILLLLLTSPPLTTRMPWLSTTSRPDWPKF